MRVAEQQSTACGIACKTQSINNLLCWSLSLSCVAPASLWPAGRRSSHCSGPWQGLHCTPAPYITSRHTRSVWLQHSYLSCGKAIRFPPPFAKCCPGVDHFWNESLYLLFQGFLYLRQRRHECFSYDRALRENQCSFQQLDKAVQAFELPRNGGGRGDGLGGLADGGTRLQTRSQSHLVRRSSPCGRSLSVNHTPRAWPGSVRTYVRRDIIVNFDLYRP